MDRTIHVLRTPEPGSWTLRKAYTNPKEYKYYTYQLLQRRIREHIKRTVICTFFVDDSSVDAGRGR